MNKLLTLFILALSLTGFNVSIYAAEEGAKAADNGQTTTEQEKKKKTAEEEEPECE